MLLQAVPCTLTIGKVVEVPSHGHEQPRCPLRAPEPRGEGHTGDVGFGRGVWGGDGPEQKAVVQAPDPCVAVLAHWGGKTKQQVSKRKRRGEGRNT